MKLADLRPCDGCNGPLFAPKTGRWFQVVRTSGADTRPWRTAPVCPVTPPPSTLTVMSSLPSSPATRSGATMASASPVRGKYSWSPFSLTMILPLPFTMRTRAWLDFLRPIPSKYVAIRLAFLSAAAAAGYALTGVCAWCGCSLPA